MLRAAAAGVFVSPRMSRDTAAVIHRRRAPLAAGHASHKAQYLRFLLASFARNSFAVVQPGFRKRRQPPQDR